jgi:hypothetical protein
MMDEQHRDDNGLYHCENGPALVYANGDQEWFQHGRHHREDGPAIIWGDKKEWWLDGYEYDPIEWIIKVHELRLK